MRKLLTGLALAAMVLLAGPAAQAGRLAAATFSLTLTGLPPATFTATYPAGNPTEGAASGTASTATWFLRPGQAPGGIASASINSLAAPPLTHIQIIVNSNPGTGFFAHTTGGAMLVTGVANVWGLGGFPAGGPPLLGVPLALGAPGTIMAGGFGVFITAFANSWTSKTTTVVLQTPQYVVHTANTSVVTTPSPGNTGTILLTVTQVTAMGGGSQFVNGAGTVVLVSAVNVLTSIAGQIPTFAVLTLAYVPEPGTLLLLGSGIAGLVVIGRRKLRK